MRGIRTQNNDHIENMMELAEGMAPSARCVRVGNYNNKGGTSLPNVTPAKKSVTEEATSLLNDDTQERPIVQEFIVERRYKDGNKDYHPQQPLSRFAQQQHKNEDIRSAATSAPVAMDGGFPSYSNIPIGLLARRKKPLHQDTTKPVIENKIAISPSNVRSSVITENDSLSTAANSSEADSILCNMSKVEVEEYLTEIHSSFSADKIAFLRARGSAKSSQKQKPTRDGNIAIENTGSSYNHNQPIQHKQENNTEAKSKTTPKDDRDLEFYQDFSNVQTPDDLDKVFHKYQSSTMEQLKLQQILQSHGISATTSSNDKGENSNISDVFYYTPKSNTQYEVTETVHNINSTDSKVTEQMEEELEYASNLLRSSSFRQRVFGAKNVADLLDQQTASLEIKSKRWPIFLPVSLRCLLDAPNPRKQYVINSYILRSIYSLLLIFAHSDHTIRYNVDDPIFLHQCYFMDDAIPTPSLDVIYPAAVSEDSSSENLNSNILYSTTNATSESAKSDGISFYEDPMWTLLSKMQIIPVIVKLLKIYTETNLASSECLFHCYTRQSLIAICGIFTMICVRSPGAACAIVDNVITSDILPLLMESALSPSYSESNKDHCIYTDPGVAIPCLVLVCTLARQSRHVASRLCTSSIPHYLQAALAVKAESDLEWRVQKLCLIIWRTFLRYSLALPRSSILVTLGAPSIKWQLPSERSLLPEYVSTFTALCHCAAILTQPSNASSNATLLEQLAYEENEAIALSGMWIAPTIQHIVAILSTNYLWDDTYKKSLMSSALATTELFRTVSSMLNLLSAYCNASTPNAVLLRPSADHNKGKDMPLEVSEGGFRYVLTLENSLAVLNAVLKNGLFEQAAVIVMKNRSYDGPHDILRNIDQLKLEASSCSLVVSFLSLLDSLQQIFKSDNQYLNESPAKQYLDIHLHVKTIVIRVLKKKVALQEKKYSHIAIDSWFNRALFSMIVFLCYVCRDPIFAKKNLDRNEILCFLRPISFRLLGQLRRGDEFMAFALLRQDIIFHVLPDEQKTVPLQRMLLLQLCDTEQSTAQLAHSINIHHHTDSPGGFVIASLRSDSERSVERKQQREVHEGESDGLSTPLLPLGPLWLFHVLSSTVVIGQNDFDISLSSRYVEESSLILISTLEILLFMEQQSIYSTLNSEAWSSFAGQIESGEKLYHLFNICFFPEGVLGDRVQELFMRLYTIYTDTGHGDDEDIIRSFGRACYHHNRSSYIPRGRKKDNDLKDKNSKSETKYLIEFAKDSCSAFLEYGAQYDVFIICIRFLMRPGFCTDVICHIILHLQDNWHLLTSPEESTNFCSSLVSHAVENGLRGGLPSLDGSCADPQQIVSAYCSVLKRYRGSSSLPKSEACGGGGGVFYVIAIATIARNFASSGDLSEALLRQRFGDLPLEAAEHIWKVASSLRSSTDGTKGELSKIALKVCSSSSNKLITEG